MRMEKVRHTVETSRDSKEPVSSITEFIQLLTYSVKMGKQDFMEVRDRNLH